MRRAHLFGVSMRICINSKNLDPAQQGKIEEYFKENFSFDGKNPTLIWKEDDSDFILLGYRAGSGDGLEHDGISHDFRTVMCRVHESELMEIAGREFLDEAIS